MAPSFLFSSPVLCFTKNCVFEFGKISLRSPPPGLFSAFHHPAPASATRNCVPGRMTGFPESFDRPQVNPHRNFVPPKSKKIGKRGDRNFSFAGEKSKPFFPPNGNEKPIGRQMDLTQIIDFMFIFQHTPKPSPIPSRANGDPPTGKNAEGRYNYK
jgi:hypothetical protein